MQHLSNQVQPMESVSRINQKYVATNIVKQTENIKNAIAHTLHTPSPE